MLIWVRWQGLLPALGGIVPAVGIDMAIYNTLKDEYRRRRLHQSEHNGATPHCARKLFVVVLHCEVVGPMHDEHCLPGTTTTGGEGENVLVSLSCGAISSVCGAVASYPLVVVRTRPPP